MKTAFILLMFILLVISSDTQAETEWVLTAVGNCPANQALAGRNSDGSANCIAVGGGSIPSGLIIFMLTGICPTGFTEVAALNGVMLRGTVAANGDVGTTGGSDTITPAGTVSQPIFTGNALGTHLHAVGTYAASAPTFTGNALGTHLHAVGTYAASAPTFTGNSLGTHLHAVGTYAASAPTFTGNALGTHLHAVGTYAASAPTFTGNAVAAASTNPTPDLVTSNTAGSGVSPVVTATGTNSAPALSGSSQAITAGTPSGTNSAPALSGSSQAITAGTPSGTNSAPALSGSSEAITAGTPNGTNSAPALSGSSEAITAGTPAGTVSQSTFAGTQFDNRPAFARVIFCSKD